MRRSLSLFALAALTVSTSTAVLAATDAPNQAKKQATAQAKQQPLTQRERALHALNRLTFGPRPGDLQRVEATGVDKWIQQQLNPATISDAELDGILQQFPAMQLSEAQLIATYPPGPMLRNMERQNLPLPTDPVQHAIYANQVAYIKAVDKQRALDQGNAAKGADGKAGPAQKNADDVTPEEMTSIQTDIRRLLALPAEERFQALLSLAPGEPRKLMQRLRHMEKLQLVEGFTPRQKEIAIALADSNRVVAGEAMEEKLLRDIYSERQLQEVMTDFWLNHFNVYVRKSAEAPWQIATYERDVIRPNALGNFENLLRAVATSPAMMTYLDNAQSIGPDSKAALGGAWLKAHGVAKAGGRGLNENYARELMELHTLGVNGGYTQQDVTEVAKVFTGWTVAPPREGGEFVYMDRRHEPGDKHVLGKTIHDDGQQEGFEVLHILATSPATAHFISRKLAVRFVSDNPSQELVNAMAKTFLSSHGDICKVMDTMLQSKEFWSRGTYRAKVKTPLEYVVSSVRATQTDATHPQALISTLNQMDMPLYGMQPPTGYSDVAAAWVNSAALLTRMNFGLALTSNKLPGLRCDLPELTGATSAATVANPLLDEAQLERSMLNGIVAPKTHETVIAEMQKLPEQEQAAQNFAANVRAESEADPLNQGMQVRKNGAGRARQVNLNVSLVGSSEASIAAGLLLGSPDFQRK
jgi:uncharacterized protein (DUF1800 family)